MPIAPDLSEAPMAAGQSSTTGTSAEDRNLSQASGCVAGLEDEVFISFPDQRTEIMHTN
jgi:hypothetical protein